MVKAPRRFSILAQIACSVSIIAAGSLGGCSSSPDPINPETGVVDLKVWVVLASGESVGGFNNFGCRLSQADMTAIVQQLIGNSSVYGGNTTFNWDGTITSMTDLFIPPNFNPRAYTVNSLWYAIDFPASPTHNSQKLNVYFGGNYTDPLGTLRGGTHDPNEAQALPSPFDRPLIFINDGDSSNGCCNGEVALITQNNILEHEMEHYLARFVLRCFAPDLSRCYNEGEHIMTQLTNLIRDGVTPPAYILYIPGVSANLATEKGEIFDRIERGDWNNP